MKKRMLLYFGSFDPIHNGHIALAEYALDKDIYLLPGVVQRE
jgi:cytidyltransferase-like protein